MAERVSDVKWTGNGAASSVGSGNGSSNGYVNGGVGVVESGNGAANGSLVKYVNGNGAVAAEAEVELVGEDSGEASKRKEDGRKKRLEEIGKEEAWFKKTGKEPVEVRFIFIVRCCLVFCAVNYTKRKKKMFKIAQVR